MSTAVSLPGPLSPSFDPSTERLFDLRPLYLSSPSSTGPVHPVHHGSPSRFTIFFKRDGICSPCSPSGSTRSTHARPLPPCLTFAEWRCLSTGKGEPGELCPSVFTESLSDHGSPPSPHGEPSTLRAHLATPSGRRGRVVVRSLPVVAHAPCDLLTLSDVTNVTHRTLDTVATPCYDFTTHRSHHHPIVPKGQP